MHLVLERLATIRVREVNDVKGKIDGERSESEKVKMRDIES